MNPDAVRPGTSDALTARTIDATIYPPLVRAQQTAVALVPRLAQAAAPLSSPLLLGALALTLVFSWVAIRMRYRPSALVLGALLVMSLTSFKPVPNAERVEAPDIEVHPAPAQVYLPPDFPERLPDWSRNAVQTAERMMRENERVREVMKQIRYRLREDARRQHWREMLADHTLRGR
ncbi:MAG: hypothetical protein M3037_12725 [Gemmatimonadota bacterium]|nr:hypothetical protein [Gemmatimonadota bacterium]